MYSYSGLWNPALGITTTLTHRTRNEEITYSEPTSAFWVHWIPNDEGRSPPHCAKVICLSFERFPGRYTLSERGRSPQQATSMSGVFKRRRTSSIVSGSRSLALGDDEVFSADSDSRAGSSSKPLPARAAGVRSASITSGAGLSSSYTLPTRSYIHHAGHGSQGMCDVESVRLFVRCLGGFVGGWHAKTVAQNPCSIRLLACESRLRSCLRVCLESRRCRNTSAQTRTLHPLLAWDSLDTMSLSKRPRNQALLKELMAASLHLRS